MPPPQAAPHATVSSVDPPFSPLSSSGISETSSMARNENNHEEALIEKTCDKWSDLNQDLLVLVMKQLGVDGFAPFSGVCKSWRSVALSNRKKFMASRSPMSIHMSTVDCDKKCYCHLTLCNRKKFMASRSPMSIHMSTADCDKKCYCHLTDPQGREFKISLPCSAGDSWNYSGSTCGYLIFYGKRNKVFFLVNPITGHQLYFQNSTFEYIYDRQLWDAVLVFSCSISRWVFVIISCCTITDIHFSIAGQATWKRVSSPLPIIDLEAFKGRVYVLNCFRDLCELTLDDAEPPKLTWLKTNKFPISPRLRRLVSSCENLYLREYLFHEDFYRFHKLDFDEMIWVSCQETTAQECIFVHSTSKACGEGNRERCKSPLAPELPYIPMIG